MSKFELQFVGQDHNLVKASFGRVPESEAVCEHVEDDCGAATLKQTLSILLDTGGGRYIFLGERKDQYRKFWLNFRCR